ncbi:MAG TPA: metabolite traffic protein EboE [Candidatus Azosocius sp. HAIN]
MNFLKKSDKYINFDLLYCTNIHFGESFQDVFFILKFYSRKFRNILFSYYIFYVGLRLSNFSIIYLSKFSFLFDFKIWLKCNNFYIQSLNAFPYCNFSNSYIKENVYFPDWGNFKRYVYMRKLIIFFSFFLEKNKFCGISTVPVSYKYFFHKFFYNNLYIKSIKYLYNLVILLNNLYINKNILIHLDIEPEPDCVISKTMDYIFFFKNWFINRCFFYIFFNSCFSKEKIYFFIFNYLKICFDICHSAVEFEKVNQSFNSIFLFEFSIGKFQISSSLEIMKYNFNIFSYLPETPYIHQIHGNNFYGNVITYKDVSLFKIFLYNEKVINYRVHYHIPIFLEFYGNFKSTQQYIIDMFNFLICKNMFFILEIETYTFEILPYYLKLNILSSLKREYDWVINKNKL